MYLELQQRLLMQVQDVARELYEIQIGSVAIEQPPDLKMGEFALPVAFELARSCARLRRSLPVNWRLP